MIIILPINIYDITTTTIFAAILTLIYLSILQKITVCIYLGYGDVNALRAAILCEFIHLLQCIYFIFQHFDIMANFYG